ncbi:RNA polymerase subunit sigma-70 [Amycolatopsis nigrescens]|uniref:RNA polymerase subunit sigma-70 n=1 Tax=Amycolatopsis nigrescens TaxID=381445 RepID=UPI001FDF1EF4|nr:RNA polymerase subunit sigma-70 [Amycolatopsis nigrescens]
MVGFLRERGFELAVAENAAAEAMTCAYDKWDDLLHPAAWVRTVAFRAATGQLLEELYSGETRAEAVAPDLQGTLVRVKRRAAARQQREIAKRVVVAATTGTLLAWPRRPVDWRGAGGWTSPRLQRQREPMDSDDRLDVLLRAARAESPQAVELLLARIRPLVLRYCRARIGRREHTFERADQVAGESLRAVLDELPAYWRRGRPFLAFVYGITRYRVSCAVPRQNYLEPAGSDDDPELNRRMTRLLGMLDADEREIVVLRAVVGLTAEETAAAVERSADFVRITQYEALSRLGQAVTSEEV